MAKKRSDAVILDSESTTGKPVGDAGSSSEPSTDGGGNPEPEFIAGYESIEPGSLGTGPGGDSGAGSRKRGRPFGSRNAKGKAASQNLGSLEGLLLSIHMMGAAMLALPELILDPKEAKLLSDAMAEVQRFYPLTFDPKIMAWLNLSIVAGGIYGPRAILIVQRLRKEKPKLIVMEKPRGEGTAAPPVNGSPGTPSGPTNPSQIFGFENGVRDDS